MAAMVKDPLQPMINRVAAAHYSPGSTFKVVTQLAAFKSGLFRPETMVNCPGGYKLGARTWRCHKESGHGPGERRSRRMQYSCDTWFFKVADTIGLDPIAEMGRALGLGSPTGIGVLGEVPGIMPTSEYHDRLSPGGYTKGMALNSAIGQGDDNVTPLQLARRVRGHRQRRHAVQAAAGAAHRGPGRPGASSRSSRRWCARWTSTPSTARSSWTALVAVAQRAGRHRVPGAPAVQGRLEVVEWRARRARPRWSRIGSVRLKKDQMDFFTRDHAWFAGFAPADKPELAVVVLNEHGGHGGVDAAPTGMAVIQKYFELEEAGRHVAAAARQPALRPDPASGAEAGGCHASPAAFRPQAPRRDAAQH